VVETQCLRRRTKPAPPVRGACAARQQAQNVIYKPSTMFTQRHEPPLSMLCQRRKLQARCSMRGEPVRDARQCARSGSMTAAA